MSQKQRPPTRGADKLLHTKLMPPRPLATVIPREDLLSRLDTGLSKKLMLVSAPTGYGKTTLASLWIASRSLHFAWVTLDVNDNDPTRFWTYFVSALHSQDPTLGKTTLSALAAPQPVAFPTLLSPLLNDLAGLSAALVLVLDEFQSISSVEITAGLEFLIQHSPEFFHLVLLSRSEPALPLGILRARAEMLELTIADLQFSQGETEIFLHETLHAELSPGTVARLYKRTEGWPAGLRLAVLALQDKDPEQAEKFIQTFSGGHRYISDYLISEVFANQSEPIQAFLLRTCFFSRLTASLCDALTETTTGATTLVQLDRDNLFIVQLDNAGDRTWYRYTSLFAESIQFLARQRFDETAIQALFERASLWYEYHGLYSEAIETALAAKLFRRAILLIETFIERHNLGEIHTLTRWLEQVPEPYLVLHPTICFTFAQVVLYSNDRFAPSTSTRIEPYLQAAEAVWRQQENQPALGQLLSFRATVAWWQSDFQKAFEYAHNSLELLAESDALWRGNSLLVVSQTALNDGRINAALDCVLEAQALSGAAQNLYGVLAAKQILSEVFYWQGQMEQAELLDRQILNEAVGDASMLDDQGMAYLSLARIDYERNELDQASQNASQAAALSEQRDYEFLHVQAVIQLAHIYVAQNDPSRAHDLLLSSEAKIQNPLHFRELQATQALITIRGNQNADMAGWLKTISAQDPKPLHLQKERQEFTLVRYLIAEGRSEEALALLKPWQKDSADHGRLRSLVEADCLEALARHDETSKAVEALNQALAIGQAHGFKRIFLDEDSYMAELLHVCHSHTTKHSLSLYVNGLLHSYSSPNQPFISDTGTRLGIEVLSQQEMRVLHLLVAGLSNPAIAEQLVVSKNTIKTQVKSIFHKLNVNSRQQASQVARELKLLD